MNSPLLIQSQIQTRMASSSPLKGILPVLRFCRLTGSCHVNFDNNGLGFRRGHNLRYLIFVIAILINNAAFLFMGYHGLPEKEFLQNNITT